MVQAEQSDRCVRVSVSEKKRLNEMTFDRENRRGGSLCRSSSKVKAIGQSSRLRDKKLFVEFFMLVVGATSSESLQFIVLFSF